MSAHHRTLNVAVVGAGYWGPNLIRNFAASPHWIVRAVADVNAAHLARVARSSPSVRVTAEYGEILSDPEIDAVAIATPVHLHYDMARAALEAGKHVLVEKPMTRTLEEARSLQAAVRRTNLVVMVDHTFLYTGAVEKLRRVVEDGVFGRLLYIDSVRVNLGLFQNGADVIYDLAPHDVSIVNHILGEFPISVGANASACIYPDIYDVAFLTLRYPSGVIAHAHLSWLSPVKVRRLTIAGASHMAIWDDVEPSDKVRIYDKGVDLKTDEESTYRRMVSYRSGDMHAPALDTAEALGKVVESFYLAIAEGRPTRASVDEGAAVVAVLEAAEKSAATNGATMQIDA